MNYYDILLIAVALSMDASAITISNCSVYKCTLTKKKEWAMPVAFAFFQGLMPLIGMLVATLLSSAIQSIAGYLSSAIFFVLSAKIFIDIFNGEKECVCTFQQAKENQEKQKMAILTFPILILQAVSTSIDALAVGITFIELTFALWIAIAIIVITTFIIVSLALLLGKKLGCVFGKYADYVGATILLILAIKSLIQAIVG